MQYAMSLNWANIAISLNIYTFLRHILCLICQSKSAKYDQYYLILIEKLVHKLFCINDANIK